MSRGQTWINEEKNLLMNNIDKKTTEIVDEYNKVFPGKRTDVGVISVFRKMRKEMKENKSGLARKVRAQFVSKFGSRKRVRSVFTIEQIEVLTADAPDINIMMEYTKRFPEDKIPSLAIFPKWIANAKKIKEMDREAQKTRLMKIAQDATNKRLNHKEVKKASAFVDESVFVEDHNLRVEQGRLMREILSSVEKMGNRVDTISKKVEEFCSSGSRVPSYASVIESFPALV
jgi:hypothetical protein